MAIGLPVYTNASCSVATLGVKQVLYTATTPGWYYFDVNVSNFISADNATVQLYCNNATLLGGAKTQQDTTGALSVPQANLNGHIQLGPEICSQTNPGADFIINQSSTSAVKRAMVIAIYQVG